MNKVGLIGRSLLLFSILLVIGQTKAQEPNQSWIKKGWTANANFGSNLFYGDIRVFNYWPVAKYNNERKFAGGIIIGKQLTSFLEFRGHLLYGSLSGTKRTDLKGNPFNQYFSTKLFEYSTTFKLNITSLLLGANDNRFLSVYTYAGMGLVNFRSQRKSLIDNSIIMSYGYNSNNKKSKATTEAVFPIGGGFDFRLLDNLKMNFDISMRLANTDKLDAYVNNSTGIHDMYGYTSIGITYLFGKNKKKDDVNVVEMPKMDPIVEPIKEDTLKVAVDTVKSDSTSTETNVIVSEPVKPENIKHDTISKTEEIKTVEPIVEVKPEVVVPEPIKETVVEIKEEPKTEIKKESKPEPKVELKKETTQVAKAEIKQEIKPETKSEPKVSSTPSSIKGIEFRVQLLAVHEMGYQKINKLKKQYSITEHVTEEHIGDWYKYTAGNFTTLEDAQKLKASYISRGVNDVFIVAYNNGSRITIAEAQALMKK